MFPSPASSAESGLLDPSSGVPGLGDTAPGEVAAGWPWRGWPVLGGRAVVSAVILSVLAALLPWNAPLGLVAVDGLLAVLLVVDWGLAAPPGRIGVVRSHPSSLALGQSGEIEWEIASRHGRRSRVVVADDLAPSLHAGSRRVAVSLAPQSATAVRTVVTPSRRGDFEPSEVVVRTYGPMGLAGRQGKRRLPSRLRVVPSFTSRKEAELRLDRARLIDVGLRSARFHGGGTEFDQLREYTPDDESRKIDWPATARAGRPIVRTYQAERNQVVLILLDNGRLMAGRLAGVPRIEHAMDAVMALTTVATRLGDRVGLVPFDTAVRGVVAPSGSPGQLRRIVDAIYRLDPLLAESNYRQAFVETLTRFKRRSLLVLLSDLADQAVQENLFSSLPLILKRHLVIVAAVRDPDVEAWAGGQATEAGTAYQKAAATEALEQRRALAVQLSSMGVVVIDAAPGRLGAALVDQYLQVKALGRL